MHKRCEEWTEEKWLSPYELTKVFKRMEELEDRHNQMNEGRNKWSFSVKELTENEEMT